jgi:hypothetical protein
MDYFLDSNILAFLPGHTLDQNKDVVILCLIPKKDILSSNNDIIISNNVKNILNIIDKKMNEYSSAVNSYDKNCHIFKKLDKIVFEKPLRFYINLKNTFNIHKSHTINKIIEYTETGELISYGITINGLFSGNLESQNIKDGLIQ